MRRSKECKKVEAKTVEVRIAVGVSVDGAWSAAGGSTASSWSQEPEEVVADDLHHHHMRITWVVAHVPLPLAPIDVEGVPEDEL